MVSTPPTAWFLNPAPLAVVRLRLGPLRPMPALGDAVRLFLGRLMQEERSLQQGQMHLIRRRLTVALPAAGPIRPHLMQAVRPARSLVRASSYVLRDPVNTTDTVQCRRSRAVVHSCLETQHLRQAPTTEIDHR